MKHFSLLAKISAQHGGMTRASFRRSLALRAAGEDVEILTFNFEPDLQALSAHLRSNGELGSLTVRNMHTEFSREAVEMSPAIAKKCGLKSATEPFRDTSGYSVSETPLASPTQDFTLTEWTDETGVAIRYDLRNRAGRLFFVDERKANTPHPRRLTLLDPSTETPRWQGGSFAFQNAWMDTLAATDTVALTIDGVAPGEAFADYVRPNVLKYLIQHNIHQEPGEDPRSGPLNPRVVGPFRSHRKFDGLVTLTQSQAEDLRHRINPVSALATIPNVNPEPAPTDRQRDPNLCVIVSRIDERHKRLTHILTAVELARRDNPLIKVDIYGGPLSGPDWELIEAHTHALGLTDAVRFLGHDEAAVEHFHSAGFTALTSYFEGQSLTIVEALSRGTLPVAYEVLYGPSELIQSGVNGWLVAPEDTAALARRMVEATDPDGPATSMRAAALRSTERFSAAVVARQWQDLYASGLKNLPLRQRFRSARASIQSISQRAGNPLELTVEITVPLTEDERARAVVELHATDHHTLLSESLPSHGVTMNAEKLVASFEIPSGAYAKLGRRDVTGWARVTIDDYTTDVRISWDPSWSAWPARSQSGQLNLR